MADQLTTVSKKRLINQDGKVSKTEMEGIERAIMTQLDL
jgi:mRNA-degrading endonuclease toxin of MazEF toxin-antitoxin module